MKCLPFLGRPWNATWLLLLFCCALNGCSTQKRFSHLNPRKAALIQQHQLALHEATKQGWAGKSPTITLPMGKLWAEKREGSEFSGQVYYVSSGTMGVREVTADGATWKDGELRLNMLHWVAMGQNSYAFPSTVDETALVIRETGISVIGPLHYVLEPGDSKP